jgi:predicted nucleic acid-binding protein
MGHHGMADTLADTNRRGTFLALLAGLRNDPDVTILEPEISLYEDGLVLYARRPDKDWSLTDCVSFVAMERWGIAASLTADQHFQQAGYRALLLEENVEI